MHTRQRIYFLDNLKTLLAAIVILVHAGQPYGPGGDWPIPAPPEIPFLNIVVIGPFFAVSSAFFMGLFFFISAHFMPGSFERKGVRRFLQDRFFRLGIPLLVLSTTVLPLIGYLFYAPEGISFVDFCLDGAIFSFGYLWFVVVLLVFALIYTLWRRAGVILSPITVPRQSALLLSALVLGLASFVVRIWFPVNQWVCFHSIEPAHLPQYLILFGAGILAFRNRWLDTLPSSVSRLWSVLVVAGVFLLMPLYLIFGDAMTAGGCTPGSFLYSIWEGFVGIGICVILIVLFRRQWNGAGPVRGLLAENVFSVYLIHLPIVLALQTLLIPVEVPALCKFFLVGAAAIPLCFLISQYLVRRIPYAERVIF
ncbi:MAG: acyltransferase family protein [Methanomicrobiaceae archaeon]|uniref:Acyltransferase 3 domain-containing protein n=1 Tax=hydrocarbon metagenome TaxID=938273 RepID=A0A0W8FEB5_9ZZZZ|nr:acyltransferase family protein [Methanomicrobiaceae archaeon]